MSAADIGTALHDAYERAILGGTVEPLDFRFDELDLAVEYRGHDDGIR